MSETWPRGRGREVSGQGRIGDDEATHAVEDAAGEHAFAERRPGVDVLGLVGHDRGEEVDEVGGRVEEAGHHVCAGRTWNLE